MIELDALRSLAESDVAKGAFRLWRSSQQDRNVTKLLRLEVQLRSSNPDVTRGDVRKLLRALEDVGCGKYVVGRKGQPSRFKWWVPLSAVGAYALGDDEAAEKLEFSPDASDGEAPRDATDSETWPTYTFPLRRDANVQIQLPPDVTRLELEKLSKFVGLLPCRNFED